MWKKKCGLLRQNYKIKLVYVCVFTEVYLFTCLCYFSLTVMTSVEEFDQNKDEGKGDNSDQDNRALLHFTEEV